MVTPVKPFLEFVCFLLTTAMHHHHILKNTGCNAALSSHVFCSTAFELQQPTPPPQPFCLFQWLCPKL